jgi:hypothetical protein
VTIFSKYELPWEKWLGLLVTGLRLCLAKVMVLQQNEKKKKNQRIRGNDFFP